MLIGPKVSSSKISSKYILTIPIVLPRSCVNAIAIRPLQGPLHVDKDDYIGKPPWPSALPVLRNWAAAAAAWLRSLVPVSRYFGDPLFWGPRVEWGPQVPILPVDWGPPSPISPIYRYIRDPGSPFYRPVDWGPPRENSNQLKRSESQFFLKKLLHVVTAQAV